MKDFYPTPQLLAQRMIGKLKDRHTIQTVLEPFSADEHHAIKAIEMLASGQIVFIVNASTLLNPNTRARQELVDLIKKYNGEMLDIEPEDLT